MRIAYHLGVHCTDDDRLVRTLFRNAERLEAEGIEVPDPARYRNLIRDTAIQLKGATADRGLQDSLLDQIMDGVAAERLILSWENFLAFPAWAVRGALYRTGGGRMQAITRIFPDHSAEFHIGLRNPATYLPELHRRQRGRDYEDFIGDADPADLRWSDLIVNLIERNPQAEICVWADEDTPLIWPEVLQAISGHAPDTALEDDEELLADLMTEEGLVRYRAYCREHPPQTVSQRRRIVTAFLEKFGRPEKMSTQATAPGWSEALVDRLTQNYWRDLDRIARTPGVRIIEP